MKSKMIAAVDERRASLELVDKVTEEMGLVGVVDSLNTALGQQTTTISLNN
jgi:hypothetical protein